ncbi:MAG TPA: DUF4153 domain-containing protein [Luteibaculaceae bacterium]|nr:DUF4153 domain-containing protein [Luteibaculaceae bacterium]
MKLPSIHYLREAAVSGLLRFPLPFFVAVLTTIASFRAFDLSEAKSADLFWLNLSISSVAAWPLAVILELLFHRYNFLRFRLLYGLVLGLFISGSTWLLPSAYGLGSTSQPYITLGLLALLFVVVALWLPFSAAGSERAFWNYAKHLVFRFILSGFFSAVIFLGLVLAYASLRGLFDVDLPELAIPKTWVVCATIIHTWIFISGVSIDFPSFERESDPGKGVKIFSQYILLPLVCLYLIILYAYGFRIVFNATLPNGWVAYLVTGISVLGVTTAVLLRPYATMKDNSWIQRSVAGFFLLLIPLLVLLFVAIATRIEAYGITINRYLLLLMGVWLSLLSLYSLVGKRDVRFFPLSLALLISLSLFGPWGLYSVSESSQVKRLREVMEKAGVMKGGKVNNEHLLTVDQIAQGNFFPKQAAHRLSVSDFQDIRSKVEYIIRHHGADAMAPWFEQPLGDVLNQARKKMPRGEFVDETSIWLAALSIDRLDSDENAMNFTSDANGEQYDVSGYDRMVMVYFPSAKPVSITFRGQVYTLVVTDSVATFTGKGSSQSITCSEWVDQLQATHNNEKVIPAKELQMTFELPEVSAVLRWNDVYVNTEKKGKRLSSGGGYLLLRAKGAS